MSSYRQKGYEYGYYGGTDPDGEVLRLGLMRQAIGQFNNGYLDGYSDYCAEAVASDNRREFEQLSTDEKLMRLYDMIQGLSHR